MDSLVRFGHCENIEELDCKKLVAMGQDACSLSFLQCQVSSFITVIEFDRFVPRNSLDKQLKNRYSSVQCIVALHVTLPDCGRLTPKQQFFIFDGMLVETIRALGYRIAMTQTKYMEEQVT